MNFVPRSIIDLPGSTGDDVKLLPAQAAGFADLEKVVPAASVTVFGGDARLGRTTVLRQFAERYGGQFVALRDVMPVFKRASIGATDSAVMEHLRHLVRSNELVVVDDLEMTGQNWRIWFNHALLASLLDLVRSLGHRLVIGASPWTMSQIELSAQRLRWATLNMFGPEDLRHFLASVRGDEAVAAVDCDLVARRIGQFDIYDLLKLGKRLAGTESWTTDIVATELFGVKGRGNIALGEVEALDFAKLPGAGHIASALETHVVLPHENPELARKLDIRAKRGVLLYGPPGSGKTSIGRALAHRMKGKFFLIDGSIPTEPPPSFFEAVKTIVAEAQANAPSVLFIDDADVLFGIVHISGFARYLLTLLDGMESESAGKVCVVMTAMNVNKIPKPILRSGRVELWLETRPPDVATRKAILARWLDGSLPEEEAADLDAIAERADGCTPADIRRVIGDARSLFAADRLAGRPVQSAQHYLELSLDELVKTRERMAEHLKDESLRIGGVRASAKYGAGIGGLVEAATTCQLMKW